ncbi:hypothetical protein QN391_15835 [Pseudomonas sp. CCI1.2]|uniref:hypothetical protein n=1 Tax=Pseudomonas sp. CCI1.2 TaxID=3048614 RepID=UPI002B22FA58|nr:hypothetical protein [Pseudomonas sp. CCI1.2]MEB0122156.1 hypothetical protein [Pseudomonas sp. CCI1.2]
MSELPVRKHSLNNFPSCNKAFSMTDQSSSSSASPSTSPDDDVFTVWKDDQANHAFIKSHLPVWYSAASKELRAALRKSQLFSLFSRRELKPLHQKLMSVTAFAEPLLEKALIKTFDLRLDLHKTIW